MQVEGELHWKIPADLQWVDTLCKELTAWLASHELSGHIFALQMLLSEALNNAIIHGAQEDPLLWVRCDLVLDADELRLKVCDDGPGFNWRDQLLAAIPEGEEVHGRGLVIYRMFADGIEFNETGNCVTLIRKINK
jgi:serine/threonine-protein kinase RsbW